MADVLSLLTERPIAYHKPLIRKFGLAPGVFLGQLLYWHGKGSKDGWIYKTQEEMKEETCLSRRNQETARKKLVEAGVLEEELRGVPARLYYRVNTTKLAECLRISSLSGSASTVCTNRANSDARTEQSITKTTQETTQERAEPLRGPRPPQIELIREITKRYPPKSIWSVLTNRLGPAPDRPKLEQVYQTWIMRGHNPLNYDGITEWYSKGIPPPNGYKQLPTQAEMNAGGRGRLVL